MLKRPIKARSGIIVGYRNASALYALAIVPALTSLTVEAIAKQERAPQAQVQIAERSAGEPIIAIVSIKSQQVTFYDADGWVFRAPVSTGVKGRETPAGVFAVLEKDEDHHSSMYDDAWMPHMQRITWNGVALHGGPLPGYAASHGCVRMPFGFAEKMFDKTRIGMRVIISPDDAAPVDFSHPNLFVPRADAVAAAPARADTLTKEAAEAAKSAETAKRNAVAAARTATSVPKSMRRLAAAKARADAELLALDKKNANAKTEEEKTFAAERRQTAAARAAELTAQLDAVRADIRSKLEAANTTKEAAKAAEIRRISSEKAATEAKLAIEPVSIYISRATQKLYVRRNTHKRWPDGGEVFDSSIEVPITIRDPEKRIGTHIFTAMAQNQGSLRWTAVTIDNADEAKNALDRIVFPQEILDRIAPTTMPRSSIIISDEPLSKETNYRTEFVAVLSNQPQGGFITRRPTTDMFARNDFRRDDDFSFFPRGWDFQGGARRRSESALTPGWWR